MKDRLTPEREAEIREHLAGTSNHTLGNLAARDLLAELEAVRNELHQERAAILHEAADAVLQSSHGEPMRDAYNAKMQAVGLLRRLAAGKHAAPVTPAETATEYGVRIPGGRVLLDGNTKNRAEQAERLERYRSKALWPEALLVQRSVSYGEWTEVSP